MKTCKVVPSDMSALNAKKKSKPPHLTRNVKEVRLSDLKGEGKEDRRLSSKWVAVIPQKEKERNSS